MALQRSTNAVDVFAQMVDAMRQGATMTPRGASDKEYFAQDWFAARLNEFGLSYVQQGRNSYPDFLVTGAATTEGYEIKSLSFKHGRPARRDIDFNSTIPSGRRQADVSCASSASAGALLRFDVFEPATAPGLRSP